MALAEVLGLVILASFVSVNSNSSNLKIKLLALKYTTVTLLGIAGSTGSVVVAEGVVSLISCSPGQTLLASLWRF